MDGRGDRYLEEDVVEAPGLGREDGRHTLLTLLDEESEVDGARASITGSPRLPWHGVGGVAVGTEGLSISPGLGDGIDSLLPVEAQELGHNGGGGDLDQDDVVETNAVVGVKKGESSLDLVGLDHGLKDVVDGEGLTLAGEVVGDSQDRTQVIRWVAP